MFGYEGDLEIVQLLIEHDANIEHTDFTGRSVLDMAKNTNRQPQILVFEDRSFTFVTKTSPAADLIKKASGVEKGSDNPRRTKVGSITKSAVLQIAQTKLKDLNASSLETAAKMIEGTARSMGIEVSED